VTVAKALADGRDMSEISGDWQSPSGSSSMLS
jgi:hypothetical protein